MLSRTRDTLLFRLSRLAIATPLLLALRNMTSRWVRTLLTMAGIIVGVAAMVAVNVTNGSTIHSINQFFDEAAGRSDLLVEADTPGGFDESLVNVARRVPGVTALAPAYIGVTILADEARDWQVQFGGGGQIAPGSQFWLMGVDPELDPLVHDYTLSTGRLLQARETGYRVVLVDTYAEDKGIEVGEDLALATPDGVARLRVVGLIAKEGIGVTNAGVIGFTPLPVAQELFAAGGTLTQLEIVADEAIAGNSDTLETLRQTLTDRLGSDVKVKYPASRGQLVANSLQNYRLGLGFFSVVSLFVGSFLIYNAFAMTIVERTREIGMMRAIGTTQGQVVALVMAEAVILGLLGSLVGVVVGLLLARGLIVFMAAFTRQALEVVAAQPGELLQAMATGVMVTLAAAFVPAFQAARISPLQALRVQGNIDESRWLQMGLKFGPLTVVATLLILYRVPFRPEVAYPLGSNAIFFLLLGATLCIPIVAGLLERLFRPLIVLLFGNEGRLGSSNINRARGRTTLTVAALMVGISMVVGISGLTQSFEADLRNWVETAVGGDLYVRSPLDMRPDLEGRLLAVDGVAAVTKAAYVSARFIPPTGAGRDGDEYTIFAAIDPETYLRVAGIQIEQGPPAAEAIQQLAAGDALLLSATLAEQYDLEVGDTLTLETRRGQHAFRIAGIIVDFTGAETPVVTGSWGDLRRYFGVNTVDRFTLTLSPDADPDIVAERIKNQVGRGDNLAVESQAEFQEKVLSVSQQAFALFDVLGLIGLVVAGLGVINTMLMNVLERTRELGSLRSLGMTQPQVRRMVLAEAMAIGLIGAVFGVAFGVVLVGVFITGLRELGGFALTAQTPTRAMITSFFIALAVALVAAWYPAVRAGRVNIIAAIKNE
ncbi:MAG: ABC transporter permease [Anaerolineales bacterium]|nr:ABC transporter permease [Anaerolineales bacterium]MCB8952001.1 ABC transporter permease [Ardenticatenales bacterium]